MRIIFFITLLILSTMIPIELYLIGVVLYALFWSGYELLILAACIDAYFWALSGISYYTLFTFVAILAIEWFRPLLLFDNR